MSRSNGTSLSQMSAEQHLRDPLNQPDTAEALNLILLDSGMLERQLAGKRLARLFGGSLAPK